LQLQRSPWSKTWKQDWECGSWYRPTLAQARLWVPSPETTRDPETTRGVGKTT
jgi:hypothetical protein